MSTLKELIEESTDHSDFMVRRLWNQGNTVELGWNAAIFIHEVIQNLDAWLNQWDSSQETIKAELTALREQAFIDLNVAEVPTGINKEMLKKGYVLAIAGRIAEYPDIVALLKDHPNRKHWPKVIKFIQSGDVGLKQALEYKKGLEASVNEDPMTRIKNALQKAGAGEKTDFPYIIIEPYTKDNEIALLAANNVLNVLNKLGASSKKVFTTKELEILNEQLASNLKLLYDNFDNLDELSAKSMSDFFRKNNVLISKALKKLSKPAGIKILSTQKKDDIAELFDQCRQKAYAKPATELALLCIEAEKLDDPSIDKTLFFEKLIESGLIGRENIRIWQEQKKENKTDIATHIKTVGKRQFGDNFFDKTKAALVYALFLNQAMKNSDNPEILNQLKKLPVIGTKEDANWAKASTKAERSVILSRINKRATEFFGQELFNVAKSVAREKQSKPKNNPNLSVEWAKATPKTKRQSATVKRNQQRGIENN